MRSIKPILRAGGVRWKLNFEFTLNIGVSSTQKLAKVWIPKDQWDLQQAEVEVKSPLKLSVSVDGGKEEEIFSGEITRAGLEGGHWVMEARCQALKKEGPGETAIGDPHVHLDL